MGYSIILTEKQLGKVVKNLMEETPGADQFKKGQFQKVKSPPITATGSEVFKNGEYEINPNDFQIASMVSKLKELGGIGTTVTIDGKASNTIWGPNKAGSPEAMKKNKELAQKRITSLLNYLQGKFPNIKFVSGTASLGSLGSTNPDSDQSVLVSFDRKDMSSKITVDRDNTSINYFNKNVDLKPKDLESQFNKDTATRVATRIPTKLTKELTKVMYDWGKTKGLTLKIISKIIN